MLSLLLRVVVKLITCNNKPEPVRVYIRSEENENGKIFVKHRPHTQSSVTMKVENKAKRRKISP